MKRQVAFATAWLLSLCLAVWLTSYRARSSAPVRQIAIASGPCSLAINAAQQAVVTANMDCDVQVAKAVQRILDEENSFKADLSGLNQRVQELSHAVHTVVQAAASPSAGIPSQHALAQLEKGDVASAITLLGQETQGSGKRAAGLYRQQAILLRFKDVHQALAALESALRFEPDDFDTLRRAGDLARIAGKTGQARALYARMSLVAERQRGLSLESTGNAWLTVGDLPLALQSHQAAWQMRDQLAQGHPEDGRLQCDLAVSHERLGDVYRNLGDLTQAMQRYKAALQIRTHYAQALPNDLQWQQALAMSHQKIGELQRAQGNSSAALRSQKTASKLRQEWSGHPAPSLQAWSPVQNHPTGSPACA
jgi:tetratricopeptide (TPR) repeat protein